MVDSSTVVDIIDNGVTIIMVVLLCGCGFVWISSIFLTSVVVAKEK